MRKLAYAMLLILLAGCSSRTTSVIGKWVDLPTGEMTVEFGSDGTARMDTDFAKQRARMIRMNPGKTQAVDAAIAQRAGDERGIKAVGLTWAKEGDFYALSTPQLHGLMRYKLDGDKLVFYNKSGQPKLEFHRVH